MPTVALPENLMNAGLTHVSDGQCLDCPRNVSVYTDAQPHSPDERGETVVVHEGTACKGFRHRFTPSEKSPRPSPACDQTGQVIEREDRKHKDAKRPHRLDAGPAPKTADKGPENKG